MFDYAIWMALTCTLSVYLTFRQAAVAVVSAFPG
jgi:hypothetical protein